MLAGSRENGGGSGKEKGWKIYSDDLMNEIWNFKNILLPLDAQLDVLCLELGQQ